MTQRNSPERRTMLIKRRTQQELREHGIWIGKRFHTEDRPKLIPAWMNRHTGKPHEHNRAKARRRARISTDASWPTRTAA